MIVLHIQSPLDNVVFNIILLLAALFIAWQGSFYFKSPKQGLYLALKRWNWWGKSHLVIVDATPKGKNLLLKYKANGPYTYISQSRAYFYGSLYMLLALFIVSVTFISFEIL